MRREVNECCDCAVPGYPCMGNACHRRHVIRIYCDSCGVELQETYFDDGDQELCEECLLGKYRVTMPL